MNFLQKLADILQPPGAGPYTDWVQHYRDTAAVGGGTGQPGSSEFGFVGGAGVQHYGTGQHGDVGHLLGSLSHDGAGTDGQGQVGAIVGGDQVGDAVQQRLAGADGCKGFESGHGFTCFSGQGLPAFF